MRKRNKECGNKLMGLEGGKENYCNYIIISKNKKQNYFKVCFKRGFKRIAKFIDLEMNIILNFILHWRYFVSDQIFSLCMDIFLAVHFLTLVLLCLINKQTAFVK